MQDVFAALIRACADGGAVLAAVSSASGSSPRDAGALMAVGPSGRLAGSVGGGRLELEAVGQARAHLLEQTNGQADFELTQDGNGMVCGGDVLILYTYLPPTNDTMQVLALAQACLSTHSPGRLVLPFRGGIGFINERSELIGLEGVSAAALAKADGVVDAGGKKFLVLPLSDPGTVHILGAGHLGRALSHLLPWLGFGYDVTDDRAEYADPALFPDAAAVHTLAYTDLDQLSVGPDDYIVILTAGHKGDYDAEKWALRTPAGYIGVVGSAAKTAHVRSLLEQDGFTQAELDRVAAPIGIPIGSDTPEEIAVSIAAQLIQERAGRRSRK
ncbi:MAG: XdhC family protein [Clostridia bacterium]|nr:XdhC family protein [Clostridia bacterium]